MMGEWADSILEGSFCEGCGEYMGEGDGYPQKCDACMEEEAKEKKAQLPPKKQREPKHIRIVALIVFVFWNVTFSSDNGQTWQTTRRQRGFDNYMGAQGFIDNAPRGVYECRDSFSGRQGLCEVSAFQIGGNL